MPKNIIEKSGQLLYTEPRIYTPEKKTVFTINPRNYKRYFPVFLIRKPTYNFLNSNKHVSP
jgi:hypothetical protein